MERVEYITISLVFVLIEPVTFMLGSIVFAFTTYRGNPWEKLRDFEDYLLTPSKPILSPDNYQRKTVAFNKERFRSSALPPRALNSAALNLKLGLQSNRYRAWLGRSSVSVSKIINCVNQKTHERQRVSPRELQPVANTKLRQQGAAEIFVRVKEAPTLINNEKGKWDCQPVATAGKATRTDADESEDYKSHPKLQRRIWHLGSHRVVCGNRPLRPKISTALILPPFIPHRSRATKSTFCALGLLFIEPQVLEVDK
jgi:hypothetical protein